jgi:hypothetical protein
LGRQGNLPPFSFAAILSIPTPSFAFTTIGQW